MGSNHAHKTESDVTDAGALSGAGGCADVNQRGDDNVSRLTYKSRDGSWGLKGLSWEQLVALPPRVYGALAKLKQMEDLVDDIGGEQPEVGGLALEELLTMGTDGIHANMREAMKWYRKRFETVT